MYKLFINVLEFGSAQTKDELKVLMDHAVKCRHRPQHFIVYQRKSHVTYSVGESKLVID